MDGAARLAEEEAAEAAVVAEGECQNGTEARRRLSVPPRRRSLVRPTEANRTMTTRADHPQTRLVARRTTRIGGLWPWRRRGSLDPEPGWLRVRTAPQPPPRRD